MGFSAFTRHRPWERARGNARAQHRSGLSKRPHDLLRRVSPALHPSSFRPSRALQKLSPGSLHGVRSLWPDADRQRCAVCRLRNILAKVPKDPAVDPGDPERRLQALVAELEPPVPSAACLADNLAALTVHLRYPGWLRHRLRSTNLLERSLE